MTHTVAKYAFTIFTIDMLVCSKDIITKVVLNVWQTDLLCFL